MEAVALILVFWILMRGGGPGVEVEGIGNWWWVIFAAGLLSGWLFIGLFFALAWVPVPGWALMLAGAMSLFLLFPLLFFNAGEA